MCIGISTHSERYHIIISFENIFTMKYMTCLNLPALMKRDWNEYNQ